MFQAKVAMDGGGYAPVAAGNGVAVGAGGPARTTLAPQMANPALGATGPGPATHQVLLALVAIEVLLLVGGRHLFRFHHGG